MRDLPRAILYGLMALAIAGCASASAPSDGGSVRPSASTQATPSAQPNAGLARTSLRVGRATISVEVADTDATRAQGLSDRTSLAQDAGMLFDMGAVTSPSFWMKGMRFPLDLVWIGEDKRVVGVTPNVRPQPGVADSGLTLYSPPSPIRYVLEVNAGAARRLGLETGVAVAFALASPTPAGR